MLKYYVALFLIVGGALFYVYSQDPCNQLLKVDFAARYPDHKVMYFGAGEGSPSSVQCHVTYRKPDGEQVYEDIWVYENRGEGWGFSEILGTREVGQTP